MPHYTARTPSRARAEIRARHRLGLLADGGGGPVAGAQALAQGDSLGGAVDEHAGRLGHAVAADDDRPLQLGDVLDLLAHLAVANVALLRRVAAERVEVERP